MEVSSKLVEQKEANKDTSKSESVGSGNIRMQGLWGWFGNVDFEMMMTDVHLRIRVCQAPGSQQ